VAQHWNPTPHGLRVRPAAIASSGSSQLRSDRPPPIRPSPPASDTAAASAPPEAPPIGASAIGCCNENMSVNAVRSAMYSIIAQPAAVSAAAPGTPG
jgi:hypothetical protein